MSGCAGAAGMWPAHGHPAAGGAHGLMGMDGMGRRRNPPRRRGYPVDLRRSGGRLTAPQSYGPFTAGPMSVGELCQVRCFHIRSAAGCGSGGPTGNPGGARPPRSPFRKYCRAVRAAARPGCGRGRADVASGTATDRRRTFRGFNISRPTGYSGTPSDWGEKNQQRARRGDQLTHLLSIEGLYSLTTISAYSA